LEAVDALERAALYAVACLATALMVEDTNAADCARIVVRAPLDRNRSFEQAPPPMPL